MPLILSDAFSFVRAHDLPAAVGVLDGFAQHGYQVVVMTRHEHVREAFRAAGVASRSLRRGWDFEAKRSIQTTDPPKRGVYLYAERQWDSEEFPGELTDRVPFSAKQTLIADWRDESFIAFTEITAGKLSFHRSYHLIFTYRLKLFLLSFTTASRYMPSFMAGAISTGHCAAMVEVVKKSSHIPLLSLHMTSALAGAMQ